MNSYQIHNLKSQVHKWDMSGDGTQAALTVASFCNRAWPAHYDGPYDFEKTISQGINTGDEGWSYRPELIAEFRSTLCGLVQSATGKPLTTTFLERFRAVHNGLHKLLDNPQHFLWRGNPNALREYPLVAVTEEQLLHFIDSYYEDYRYFKAGMI